MGPGEVGVAKWAMVRGSFSVGTVGVVGMVERWGGGVSMSIPGFGCVGGGGFVVLLKFASLRCPSPSLALSSLSSLSTSSSLFRHGQRKSACRRSKREGGVRSEQKMSWPCWFCCGRRSFSHVPSCKAGR